MLRSRAGRALAQGAAIQPARPAGPDLSQPACLKPRSHGQHITFGVVNVKPAGGTVFGGPVVVWIECARSPVPRYPIVTLKASGPP